MNLKLGLRELLFIFLCVILLFKACTLSYVELEGYDL